MTDSFLEFLLGLRRVSVVDGMTGLSNQVVAPTFRPAERIVITIDSGESSEIAIDLGMGTGRIFINASFEAGYNLGVAAKEDPRFDFDVTGYGVVEIRPKCLPEGS